MYVHCYHPSPIQRRNAFAHSPRFALPAHVRCLLYPHSLLPPSLPTTHTRPTLADPFTKKSLTSYPGSYVIRKLEGCSTGEGEQIAEKLKAFAREIHGRPYNHNLMEMVHAAGIMGDNKKCDPSSLFCSELVAESLKHMGLMGSERWVLSYSRKICTLSTCT